MRIDILANNRASFVKPIAEGLHRMLTDLGVNSVLHYDGLSHLMRPQQLDPSSFRRFAGSGAKLLKNRRVFNSFLDAIAETDAIVVVANVPGSFSPGLFPNIEVLRERLPRAPIINYDLHYLPTLDSWARFILRDERTALSSEAVSSFSRGKFGLERYDWYLMGSVATFIPVPPGSHPYSLIGIDIDDGTLYPAQRGQFRALVDFEQNWGKYPKYRAVQLEALRIAGVDFEILAGDYSSAEIRAIYRRTSIYFLAFAEAFGLPIAEVQACGGMIFTPDAHWACAHWLGKNYAVKREPRLSPNFVVYENDADKLAAEILAAAENWNPERVRQTFLLSQPELFHGDRNELEKFLEMLGRGEIHSQLHHEHWSIGRIPKVEEVTT